jgi:PPOX class probable F420-dependent enzyme
LLGRKIPTSIEIVDVPPPKDNETSKAEDVSISVGTTKLSKDELHNPFWDRNLAFIATLSKDGSPHVTPVWTELVDDLIFINTFETSAKNRHITIDKRIALSIVEQTNPSSIVTIKGKVIEQTTEGADDHLKRLAKKYLGIGKYYYRKPNHNRIILKIQPEKIMGLSIHPTFYLLAYSPWNK